MKIKYKDREFNFSKKYMNRFWAKVNIKNKDECWEWKSALNNSGYGSMSIERFVFGAHCISYLIKNGEIPNGFEVRHICNNRKCVNPEHLTIGTRVENMQDAIRAGRFIRGENHPKSKLKKEDVLEIRKKYSSGKISMSKLGKEYGVSAGVIHRILHGTKWRHVGGIQNKEEFRFGAAKLKEDDVLYIRGLSSKNSDIKQLSSCFGVTERCIEDIIKNKTWSHL